jgi:spore germination protein
MTITNTVEGGTFSGEITSAILNDEAIEDRLIDNVLEVLERENYYGVVVDFEYINPADRDNFTRFLTKLTQALHPLGFLVFVAVAPKIRADQPGTLYEAHDYEAIGRIVDRVIIMTYEWGYMFGPPMAVAPLNSVREVLDYAVTAIPPEKILMGIPNYGYDWTLPFVQGTAARVVSNAGAVNLAREVGAVIEFDQTAQSPFFTYYRNNSQHIVWFEDARSIDAKLRLVEQYNLAGVSYWELSNYFPQNWLVQDSLFNVVKVID